MRGKRSLLKLASVFLLRRLFPRLVKRRSSYSKLTALGDIYKEYKALKRQQPLKIEQPGYQSRKFKRSIKMMQRNGSPLDASAEQLESPTPQSPNLSRRQRLIGLAKATRDSYMPKISLIASGVSSRALGGDYYDENGNVKLPKDATITLFPAYTRKTEDGKYHVDVKGWLSCPGVMSRKNRLILSLAKQITRYSSNPTTAKQAINELEDERLEPDVITPSDDAGSEVESINSRDSSINTISPNENKQLQTSVTNSSVRSNTPSFNDDLLKERLSHFIARSIASAELVILIGSQDRLDLSELKHTSVITDGYGHFEACVEVSYAPSVVQVKAATDESIFSFQDIMLIPSEGIGLISDIDDTIKLTGVTGDKRELMRNILLNDVNLWNIPPVVKWYTQLHEHESISFHYVSNSPWQLFSSIHKYFQEVKLPLGSVHLKQYTGSFISSLMEPSSSRKKRALSKIAEDFPKKKFICVGDSGEHDLEAYADLARSYPSRIIAIYIRCVEDSLSDVDDKKILKELTKLTSKKIPKAVSKQVSKPNDNGIENLIDLSDDTPVFAAERSKKLPPMIPHKPTTLQGKKLSRKPPLPIRDELKKSHTDTELAHSSSTDSVSSEENGSSWKNLTGIQSNCNDNPPPMPLRRPTSFTSKANAEGFTSTSNNDYNVFDNLQDVYNTHKYYELEDVDKKGAQWIRRVVTAMEALEGTGTKIKFFTDDEHDFFNNSIDIVRDYLRTNNSN